MSKLIDFGGSIIPNAVIQPICWGKEWNDPASKSQATSLVASLKKLFAGPYMLGLTQYRGVQSATVMTEIYDPSSSPAVITRDNLASYLAGLIAATPSTVPDFRVNNQLLYLVLTLGKPWDTANVDGYHYWGQVGTATFSFAWAETPSSTAVSHEVVEACTDATGSGFFTGPGGIEVADICEETVVAFGFSDGVEASSYWSDKDTACILPKRVAHIAIDDNDECRIGPSVGSQSKIRVSSIGIDPPWIDASNISPISNLTYNWSYPTASVQPIGPTTQSTLEVLWTSSSSTTIDVQISTAENIVIEGSVTVTPRSQKEANILAIGCELRKYLNSVNRIPPYFVHKLGPDPVELPTEADVKEMSAFARSLTQQIEKISLLMTDLRT